GALAAERCTFIVDDAHHAGRGAGLLIERLAEQLPPDQHLIVLARHLPPGTARLRRADCVQLTAADLALRPDEALQLCRTGFGLDSGPAEVTRLERSTGGGTAGPRPVPPRPPGPPEGGAGGGKRPGQALQRGRGDPARGTRYTPAG